MSLTLNNKTLIEKLFITQKPMNMILYQVDDDDVVNCDDDDVMIGYLHRQNLRCEEALGGPCSDMPLHQLLSLSPGFFNQHLCGFCSSWLKKCKHFYNIC
jgi:hypothetical protein